MRKYTCDGYRKYATLVPEVFFRREETRQERERSDERKPVVAVRSIKQLFEV